MSVNLAPSNSLGFNRPFTQTVKRQLTITNPNSQPVAFKVKTTAPKLYCVRPNSGRIYPGDHVEVAVMLQAMREEPPLAAKCRDKFLIQSTLITWEKETMPLQDIWAAADSGGEDARVFQQKLRVQYLPPEGQTLEEEDEGQADMGANEPHPNGHSLHPILADEHAPPAGPANQDPTEAGLPRPNTPPADFSVAREESTEEPVQRGVSHVDVDVQSTPISSPSPEPGAALVDDDMLAKYHEAQAEIERLRNLLAAVPSSPPDELRRRNRALSDDGSTVGETEGGTVIEENPLPQEGVPLQVVVIIALGVFITTYLFF